MHIHTTLFARGWRAIHSTPNGYYHYERQKRDNTIEWIDLHPRGDARYGVGNVDIALGDHAFIVKVYGDTPNPWEKSDLDEVDETITDLRDWVKHFGDTGENGMFARAVKHLEAYAKYLKGEAQ